MKLDQIQALHTYVEHGPTPELADRELMASGFKSPSVEVGVSAPGLN